MIMSLFHRLLLLGGIFSLALALFQAVISVSPAWSVYFGAPASMAAQPLKLLAAGWIAALFFALFGLYGLSAAGRFRRLPLLRWGILAIGLLYFLRGVMVFPQLGSEGMPDRFIVYSAVSLAAGIIHLAGVAGAWRTIPGKQSREPRAA
ncbi:MAG: hypothetical protein C4524_06650 [Candidatus Zixiibacteriota bacterium]|nr:MAG: hypothetical protein C4524_06650 [candidate division Zixibacteria bacterium]